MFNYNKKKITRRLEDMNFILRCFKVVLTSRFVDFVVFVL